MSKRILALIPALACLSSTAWAWEVVGGSLPTFAQEGSAASASLIRPWSAMTGDPFRATALPAGYDVSLGKGLLLGVRNWSDTAPGFSMGALAPMGFSGSQVKLGFNMGGALTPYVSVAQGMARSPFSGMSSLTGGYMAAPGNPHQQHNARRWRVGDADSLQLALSRPRGRANGESRPASRRNGFLLSARSNGPGRECSQTTRVFRLRAPR